MPESIQPWMKNSPWKIEVLVLAATGARGKTGALVHQSMAPSERKRPIADHARNGPAIERLAVNKDVESLEVWAAAECGARRCRDKSGTEERPDMNSRRFI